MSLNFNGNKKESGIKFEETNISEAIELNTDKVTFPEAPNNDEEYVRKNKAWQIASNASGTVEEAPNNGEIYGRKDLSWISITGINVLEYVIENDRWGIYSDNTHANETKDGINNAIIWAKANGYNTVVLTDGDYAIYGLAERPNENNNGIQMLDNMNFTMMNGATLYIPTNESVEYAAIYMNDKENIKISGGKIVGDRSTHIYGYNLTMEAGGLDGSGNEVVDGAKMRMNIPFNSADHPELFPILFRYKIIADPSMAESTFDVFYYDQSDVFISSTTVNFETAIQVSNDRKMKIVVNEAFFSGAELRLEHDVWATHEFGVGVDVRRSRNIEIRDMEILDTTGDAVLLLNEGGVVCENILVERCKLYNCRRLGVGVTGVINSTIRDCEIYDINGTAPEFGIDLEGHLNDNLTVINNYIYDCSSGGMIAYTGDNYKIQDNTLVNNILKISDCDNCIMTGNLLIDTSLIVVRQLYTDTNVNNLIEGNAVYGGAISIGESTGITSSNNKVYNGSYSINGADNFLSVNNTIYSDDGLTAYGYRIRGDSNGQSKGDKISGIFTSASLRGDGLGSSVEFYNLSVSNYKLGIQVAGTKMTFNGLLMDKESSTELNSYDIIVASSGLTSFSNCIFRMKGRIYVTTATATTEIINSKFESLGNYNLIDVDEGRLNLINCLFEVPTTLADYLVKARDSGVLYSSKNTFMNEEVTSILVLDTSASSEDCYIINNDFKNCTFTNKVTDTQFGNEWGESRGGQFDAISALDYGATGDGVTDDTSALESAIVALKSTSHKTLYFPIGTYLTSRALYMESGMQFIGANGATITKGDAITQLIQVQVEIGETTVVVQDGSAFTIGHDIFFHNMTNDDSPANGTIAKITDINGNILTFDAYRSAGSKSQETLSAETIITQAHPLISTNTYVASAENIVIKNLTLDGNKAVDEPHAWVIAPIHIDTQTGGAGEQNYNRIIDNTIINSATDGISSQAEYDVFIKGNRVSDCVGKGIHIGTTIDKVIINNNIIENCEDCAMFYCFGINKVIFTNNTIINCRQGIDGLDLDGDETIITGNIFDRCENPSISLVSGKVGAIISQNIFKTENLPSNAFVIESVNSDFITITDNQFIDYGSGASSAVGIQIRGCEHINISNNYFDYSNGEFDYVIEVIQTNIDVGITNNKIITLGDAIILVDTIKSDISNNYIDVPSGKNSIDIQSTCSDIRADANFVTEPILSNGTRTILNGVCQDDFGGQLLDPRLFSPGDSVIDTSNDQFLILNKTGLAWQNITNNVIDALTYFYDEGIEVVSIIEGVNTAPADATYTENVNNITLRTENGNVLSAVTESPVDLTDIDVLYVDWENTGDTNGYNYSYIKVTSDPDGHTGTLASESMRQDFTRRNTKLDVSGITGNAYVSIVSLSSSGGVISEIIIHKIAYLDLTKSNVADMSLGEEGAPASSSAYGAVGQIKWDVDYIYICVATDTWKRSPITTW